MSIQKIIELINSNMFLVVSYSLIFILLSGYALRFLAKLFMFFIILGIFVFAMTFMFSNTPGFDVGELHPGKIINNISKSIGEVKQFVNDNQSTVNSFKDMMNSNNINKSMSQTQSAFKNIKSDVYGSSLKDVLNGPNSSPVKQTVPVETQPIDRSKMKVPSSYN